jgi:hypothetical protein
MPIVYWFFSYKVGNNVDLELGNHVNLHLGNNVDPELGNHLDFFNFLLGNHVVADT